MLAPHRRYQRVVLLLLALGLLAGCRSEQVAFQFQPVSTRFACSKIGPLPPGKVSMDQACAGTLSGTQMLQLPAIPPPKRQKPLALPTAPHYKPSQPVSLHRILPKLDKKVKAVISSKPTDSDYGLTLRNIIIVYGGALLLLIGLSFLMAGLLGSGFWVGFAFTIIALFILGFLIAAIF